MSKSSHIDKADSAHSFESIWIEKLWWSISAPVIMAVRCLNMEFAAVAKQLEYKNILA